MPLGTKLLGHILLHFVYGMKKADSTHMTKMTFSLNCGEKKKKKEG